MFLVFAVMVICFYFQVMTIIFILSSEGNIFIYKRP